MSALTIHNDYLGPAAIQVPGKPWKMLNPGLSASSQQSGALGVAISAETVISGKFPSVSNVDIYVTDSAQVQFILKNQSKLEAIVTYGSDKYHIEPGSHKEFNDPGEYVVALDSSQTSAAILDIKFLSDVKATVSI
ncbi:hypothetical protein AX15_004533 [Amanita polypyramis BW_CC]|nr:hypothetical protein AX15_004533 [Amanita polypyramis BW_CC]